ncbi:MAG: purine-nucleoside/S-methyl-5-thioadenosine phosphorylase / adenosine deaminase [Alphaproteobacteria bacterium]|jgi:YfiH family protein|nr:purine-nucleoside/S-methyl-5-thioadenosine phosphorylase / adenosine deaminase [Alphaproteobacteria bacterium]
MLQAQSLSRLPGVRHGFFNRFGGVSDGFYESLNGGVGSEDAPAKVAENRARMAASLGVAPERFLTCYQIHSPAVVVAETPWPASDRPRADAIVTRVPGLAIGVSTADCGPVLLADATARVIGAAHAGWRGALTGVIESTVAAMEKLGASRGRIVAAAGPMIRQPSYEVGQDLIDRFVAVEPNTVRFFKPAKRTGHAMFDLAGYVVSRLQRAEVGAIEDLGLCTYADPAQFYSYRRATHLGEADYGRHINAIALAD